MARVTLEGSITPSTFLARGKRMTVERTEFIDKLIRRGYVNVVATPDAVTEVESITAPKLEAAKAEKAVRKTARKRVTKPKTEPAERVLSVEDIERFDRLDSQLFDEGGVAEGLELIQPDEPDSDG